MSPTMSPSPALPVVNLRDLDGVSLLLTSGPLGADAITVAAVQLFDDEVRAEVPSRGSTPETTS